MRRCHATKVGGFGGVGLAAGTFGLIIALVFWAYYSGIVLIVGALVTLLHEARYRLRLSAAQVPPDDAGEPPSNEDADSDDEAITPGRATESVSTPENLPVG